LNFLKRFDKSNIPSLSLANGMKERAESSGDKIEILKRISKMYQRLKADSKNINELYVAGGEWDNYIAERHSFYNDLLEDNYDRIYETLSNFWRNDLSPIVKEYAKYDQIINDEVEFVERFVNRVSKNYLIWKELFDLDVKDLRVPDVGNHWGLEIEGEVVVPKATRYHTHGQQVKNLTKDISHPIFAEIGAGYCGLAYYMLKEIPGLTYIDFDLPEMLVIGAYYIMSAAPDKKVLLYGEYDNVAEINLDDYDCLFLPNFELPNFPNQAVDVFYNSFSLSEMPKSTSTEYIKCIEKICRLYFLHNNMDRKGVINRGFERTPASEYQINESAFKLIYKQFDLFHGHDGDYKEFLYQRIGKEFL
jgi:hypothetical protein